MTEPASDPPELEHELSARLLLYALEAVGDPGAAEALMVQAAGRALRWSRPAGRSDAHRPMLRALTAMAQGALNRCPRPRLPAGLLPEGDRFDHDVETALSALAGRERAALFLVLVEGLSYEECAGVLRTTPANTGLLVYRARAALRSCLVGAPPAPGESGSTPALASTNQRLSRVLRSDCRQAAAYISADIDGELLSKQAAVLAEHMAGCGICGEERARLEQASAAVRAHWKLLLEQLVTGGWAGRAGRATLRGSAPATEAARVRRLRSALAAACLAILAGGALVILGPCRRAERAVTWASGDCSERGGVYQARGEAGLGLFDGSQVQLEPGAVLAVRRVAGLARPRLKLMAGAVTVQVSPAAHDLVVETAAGRVGAGSGGFRARLAARDTRGALLAMRFTTAESLAPGERLCLAVDADGDRVLMAGLTGPDTHVPRGALAAVPTGEQPRLVAVPGKWLAAPRAGSDPPERYGAALGRDEETGLLVMFGGRGRPGAGGELDELWVTDPVLGGWSALSAPGDGAGRREPGAAPQPDRPPAQSPLALLTSPVGRGLWLCGAPSGSPELAGLWHLELPGPAWRRVDLPAAPASPAPVPAPPKDPRTRPRVLEPPAASPVGRSGPALTAWRAAGGIVLVGGEAGGRRQRDTWLLDLQSMAWRRLDSGEPHPEARTGAALTASPDGGKLYLFGGIGAAGRPLDDTWCLELGGGGKAAWRLLKTAHRPPARSLAAMAPLGDSGEVALFGGRPRLGGPRSDTWVLTPGEGESADWTSLVTVETPPAAEFPAPAMVWDPGCRALALSCGGSLWLLRPRESAPAGSRRAAR